MTELETANKRIAALEAEVKLLSDLVQEVVAIGQQEHAMRLELETWLAAMRAGGGPVAEMVPFHTPSGKRVAIISMFQHLPIGTKLYTHPQPAAQDAGRYRLLRRGQHWSVTDGIGDDLRGEELDYAIDAAIAAKQGDGHE